MEIFKMYKRKEKAIIIFFLYFILMKNKFKAVKIAGIYHKTTEFFLLIFQTLWKYMKTILKFLSIGLLKSGHSSRIKPAAARNLTKFCLTSKTIFFLLLFYTQPPQIRLTKILNWAAIKKNWQQIPNSSY